MMLCALPAGGIRYIDYRLFYDSNDGNKFFFHHSFQGSAMWPTFDDIKSFLDANPFEIVMIQVSHLSTSDLQCFLQNFMLPRQLV